ncbi:MAG: glutaredoxin family protein [Lautropia sp.]|nr:glutaredoxin family protein [Lautropia sp.]
MKATPAKLLLLAACALSAASAAAAEYKWMDADGGIVYGDVPPPEGAVALRQSGSSISRSVDLGRLDPILNFPMALRTAARNHPVTLYSANDCQPCQMAREHLKARGIPFQEWLVSSHEDFERFRALGFTGNGFPALTIGDQRSIGFEADAWSKTLDSVGYPKTSQLPSTYQYPTVTRLSNEPGTQGEAIQSRPQRQTIVQGDVQSDNARPSRRESPPIQQTIDSGIRF